MLLVASAVLLSGCPSPRIETTCGWASHWIDSDEMIPKEKYAEVLEQLFRFDQYGLPTQNVYLFDRLNQTEKFCHQMRAD